jgi:hypothetical protein
MQSALEAQTQVISKIAMPVNAAFGVPWAVIGHYSAKTQSCPKTGRSPAQTETQRFFIPTASHLV